MTAQAAISLNGKSYSPAGVRSGVATWFYRVLGIANGFSKLTSSLTRTGGASRNYKTDWLLAIPVVATESNGCVCEGDVTRTAYLQILSTVSPASTTVERQELLDQLDDLVASAAFRASILDLEPVW